jgi:RNA polymerase sigma factor (sigma-70 family)
MTLDPAQEIELVLRARDGDYSSFAELYDAYVDRIHDFCYQMVRNRDDAADLVSDVFLKAMERLTSLKDPAAFRGWLYAIARNSSLTLLGRRGRTTAMPDDYEPVASSAGAPPAPDPSELAESSELTRLVWEAAATLNPRDYSIFEMTVRQGLDSAEVAEALGVKPAHAYVLVSRLKDSIEDALGAVVLARAGRRDCAVLDGIVSQLGDERSPRLRKAVGRHLRRCDDCRTSRKKYSVAALLGGVAYALPGPGLKEAVAQNVAAQWPVVGPGAGTPAAGGLSRLARVGSVPAALVIFVLVTAGQHASPQALSNLWPFRVEEVALTPSPSPEITPVPVADSTPEPTPEPTLAPRVTARPTRRPTAQPTRAPTPSPKPTLRPTLRPTLPPTLRPRPTPTPVPKPPDCRRNPSDPRCVPPG